MDKDKQDALSAKRKQLQLNLTARELVKRKIGYHWMEIFEAIKEAGINYQIEYLCVVPEELHPYILKSIEDLKLAEFNEVLVKTGEQSMMDLIFEKYPSTEPLKYIPELSMISTSDNLKLVFEQADNLLNIRDEFVYFFSPDWWPVLKLNWHDVLIKGSEIFADIPLPFLFTDMSHQKILFKSLEDEWRISEFI